jgi:DnaJ-class molecular chaperone
MNYDSPPNAYYTPGGAYGSPEPDVATDQRPKTCFYKVLGIPRSTSEDDTKKAYRTLSLENHPDRVAEEDKDKATEKMVEINQANDVLSNAQKRRYYDRTGKILSHLDM